MSAKRKSAAQTTAAQRSSQLQQAHKQSQPDQMADVDQHLYQEFLGSLSTFNKQLHSLLSFDYRLSLHHFRPPHIDETTWSNGGDSTNNINGINGENNNDIEYLDYFQTNPSSIEYHVSQRYAHFNSHQPSKLSMLYAQPQDQPQLFNGQGSGSMIDHLLLGRANIPLTPGNVPIHPGAFISPISSRSSESTDTTNNELTTHPQCHTQAHLLGLTHSTPLFENSTEFSLDDELKKLDLSLYNTVLDQIPQPQYDLNTLRPKPTPASIPTDAISKLSIRQYLDSHDIVYDEDVINVLQSLTTSLVVDVISKQFKASLHRLNLPSKYLPTIPNPHLNILARQNYVNKAQQIHSTLINDSRVQNIVKNDPNIRRKHVLSSFLRGKIPDTALSRVTQSSYQTIKDDNFISKPKIINSPVELPLIIISSSHITQNSSYE